ncbi:carboxylesterase/lipase family protein [Aestuariimicrobium soli]|uniref:carboxylesterase/lipase family protein n=1 Tax=Aestuariimicrobium soli TaxID=2035834 RepID=UPI003EB8287A
MPSLSRRHVLAGGAAAAAASALTCTAAQAAPAQAAPTQASPTRGATVKVTGGVVRGTVDANGVKVFKGIPYAASTAGPNRWGAPQPVVPWTGVRSATEFGPIAVQNVATAPFGPWTWEYLDTFMSLENGLMGEDCLRVNVWTTATPNANRPVIVYIHGGANTSGSGGNEVYTGENIAQQGVVHVTINYRVGIFGFLAMKDAAGDEVTGNFAFLDMVAALRWVRDNIAAFGGDPGNVTVAGQSAGSSDIQTLIASPAAAGLFRRAVTMSSNSIDRAVTSLAQAQDRAGQAFGEFTLAQLRSMSAQQVQALTSRYNPSGAVIDGAVVTSSLTEAYAAGTANAVDLMIGNVDGDAGLFGLLRLPDDNSDAFDRVQTVTPAAYAQAVTEQFGAKFLELYPADPTATNVIETARALQADGLVAQAMRQAEVRASHYADRTTLVYEFSRDVPDTPERMAAFGPFHTGDVGYWFNYFSDTWHRPWTSTDRALGVAMSNRLVEFATTGKVSGWPALRGGESAREYLHLTDAARTAELSPAKAAAWARYWTP